MYKIRYALLPNHGTQGLHKELELDTTHIIPYNTDEHKIIQRTKKKIYDNHQLKKYIYIQAPMPTHTLQLFFKMMVCICRL